MSITPKTMIEKVLHPKNLTKAQHKVVGNKGSAGVDGMKVSELRLFIDSNRNQIVISILNRTYIPKPIKGRAEREENFLWKFLARSQLAGMHT